MDGDDFYVEVVGDRRVLQNLDQLPDTVKEILRDKVLAWVHVLEDTIISNIESRLKSKSGRLLASVKSEMIDNGTRIDGRVYITAPYAAAQDKGAVTPPHVILPRNGKLLAFVAATGDKVMVTKVNHPGGIIPASRFAKDAYSSIGPKISRDVKNSVIQGIRAKMRNG